MAAQTAHVSVHRTAQLMLYLLSLLRIVVAPARLLQGLQAAAGGCLAVPHRLEVVRQLEQHSLDGAACHLHFKTWLVRHSLFRLGMSMSLRHMALRHIATFMSMLHGSAAACTQVAAPSHGMPGLPGGRLQTPPACGPGGCCRTCPSAVWVTGCGPCIVSASGVHGSQSCGAIR